MSKLERELLDEIGLIKMRGAFICVAVGMTSFLIGLILGLRVGGLS